MFSLIDALCLIVWNNGGDISKEISLLENILIAVNRTGGKERRFLKYVLYIYIVIYYGVFFSYHHDCWVVLFFIKKSPKKDVKLQKIIILSVQEVVTRYI